ncbi:MAG: hypothetical protein K9G48_08595 [Reyranella sp.]|nr:hypothetical protein [Reyranella sp.]
MDELKRERDIEGEIGVFLRVTDSVFLRVLCQSDANPRYRELGPKRYRELRRQANAKATPEQLTERWAELFVDTVIIGWEGVTAGREPDTTDPETGDLVPGKPIQVPFSRAACIAWILQHPRIIKIIDKFTEDETMFRRNRAEDIKDDVKND